MTVKNKRLNCALRPLFAHIKRFEVAFAILPPSPPVCTASEVSTCLCVVREHHQTFLHRKEVIQPQVPLRLPCYDFIPVTSHALGRCLFAVGADTSGETGFHDVTGGVYKTRERIHGAVADAPLLAIPTSCRRVAASNLNWARFFRFPPPRGIGSHCAGHCSTCAALAVRAILT
jgi:hypothetical protein